MKGFTKVRIQLNIGIRRFQKSESSSYNYAMVGGSSWFKFKRNDRRYEPAEGTFRVMKMQNFYEDV